MEMVEFRERGGGVLLFSRSMVMVKLMVMVMWSVGSSVSDS